MSNDGLILWSPGTTLEAIEQQVIAKAYRFYQGNKTVTAQALGISINTLTAKLEKIENERKRREADDERERQLNEQYLMRARGIAPTNPALIAESEARRKEMLPRTHAGVYMEPTDETSAKQAMPMPERKEVQKVLPAEAAASGAGKGRKTV